MVPWQQKKRFFWNTFWLAEDFLAISLFSKPFYSMLAYAEVCWSKGIAVYFPLPSPMPSDEYGECSCSWYKRKCLPLIKDLLQSANLIQSSAVLCSMLNASRSFMANRSPHLLHRGLHFVCPQTDTIQCSTWVSLAHQVECVLWFYHPFFFPMLRMFMNMQNNFPPVSSIKCVSTKTISSQRPWHPNVVLLQRWSLCVHLKV